MKGLLVLYFMLSTFLLKALPKDSLVKNSISAIDLLERNYILNDFQLYKGNDANPIVLNNIILNYSRNIKGGFGIEVYSGLIQRGYYRKNEQRNSLYKSGNIITQYFPIQFGPSFTSHLAFFSFTLNPNITYLQRIKTINDKNLLNDYTLYKFESTNYFKLFYNLKRVSFGILGSYNFRIKPTSNGTAFHVKIRNFSTGFGFGVRYVW